MVLVTGSPLPTVLAGAVSFSYITLSQWNRWTPCGGFGPANTVTLLRLMGILALGLLANHIPDPIIGVTALTILLLDGLDGWLAKRLGQTSLFGEYFDKESDALFILILCLTAILKENVGHWILVVGSLRYGFVLVRHFLRPTFVRERKSVVARWIAGWVMFTLIFSFSPWPVLYQPVLISAAVLVTISFIWDFRWILAIENSAPS